MLAGAKTEEGFKLSVKEVKGRRSETGLYWV